MKAAVVIGANYGDEGKGLITDYLASASSGLKTLVIRFNGGAQAGHTVHTPNGLRHVFSHFSSGTFTGAQTYLSAFFIANPILFVQELKKLYAYQLTPKITIHPMAIVTTPYDMYINQLVENFKANNRHGSCGVGINETVERNSHPKYQLTVKDLFDQQKLKEKLLDIRDEWLEFRVSQLLPRKLSRDERELIFSEDIFEYFLNDIRIFLTSCDVAEHDFLRKWDKLIFEGAQGLLLDQGHKNFPHVTRSNTGLQNVSTLASLSNIRHLDIHYVTRCYLTRHGAGPLPHESFSSPPQFKDQTNLPHEFQGTLRFAPLNIHQLNLEIMADLNKLSKDISRNITLAMTCLDQFEEKIPIIEKEGNLAELKKNEFFDYVVGKSQFDNYLLSYGPTRHDCKPFNN